MQKLVSIELVGVKNCAQLLYCLLAQCTSKRPPFHPLQPPSPGGPSRRQSLSIKLLLICVKIDVYIHVYYRIKNMKCTVNI